MTSDHIRSLVIVSMSVSFVLLGGCSYRLPVATLRREQHVKIVAPTPERFTVRLHLYDPRDYPVPLSGRVTLQIPAYRAGCSIYLFDRIRLARGADPYTQKRIELLLGSSAVRKMSLQQITQLPQDPQGYRVLNVASR